MNLKTMSVNLGPGLQNLHSLTF